MSSMLWETSSTVLCRSRWYWVIWARSTSRPRGSRPAVGSSRMSTSGSMAMTPAMAARRFSPPDSSKGDFSSSSCFSPVKWAARRARSWASSSGEAHVLGAEHDVL